STYVPLAGGRSLPGGSPPAARAGRTLPRGDLLFGGPPPPAGLGGALWPGVGPRARVSTPAEDVVRRAPAGSPPALSVPIASPVVSSPVVSSPSIASVGIGPAPSAPAPVLNPQQRLHRDKATLIAKMAPGETAVERLLRKIIKAMDTSADPYASVST